jgi:hypothetical protein
MRYINDAFCLFKQVGGREAEASANKVIFFSLSECLISLLSRSQVREIIYRNRTPLVLGRDYHVPQEKSWIGSLIVAVPGWRPVAKEEMIKTSDDLRVEHMELLLSGEFKKREKTRMSTNERRPGSKEAHWKRMMSSLAKYDENIQKFYPTQRELDIDARDRRGRVTG